MSAARARRERLARLADLAEGREQQARLRAQLADNEVASVDRQREAALRGAAELAGEVVGHRLGGLLATAGARRLTALAEEKAELSVEADERRAELAAAVTRTRSLQRLGERLDRAEAEEARRREQADLQDLMAIRAAADARTGAGHRRGVTS